MPLCWCWIVTKGKLIQWCDKLRRQKCVDCDVKTVDLIKFRHWLKPLFEFSIYSSLSPNIFWCCHQLSFDSRPPHYLCEEEKVKLFNYCTFHFQYCRSQVQIPRNLQIHWHTWVYTHGIKNATPNYINAVLSRHQHFQVSVSIYFAHPLIWTLNVDCQMHCHKFSYQWLAIYKSPKLTKPVTQLLLLHKKNYILSSF